MSSLRPLALVLLLAFVPLLAACPPDPPCSDLGEAACLEDARCEVAYLESCGCMCSDEGCAGGCCTFDSCIDAG